MNLLFQKFRHERRYVQEKKKKFFNKNICFFFIFPKNGKLKWNFWLVSGVLIPIRFTFYRV